MCDGCLRRVIQDLFQHVQYNKYSTMLAQVFQVSKVPSHDVNVQFLDGHSGFVEFLLKNGKYALPKADGSVTGGVKVAVAFLFFYFLFFALLVILTAL